jgi:hypothetical protein
MLEDQILANKPILVKEFNLILNYILDYMNKI